MTANPTKNIRLQAHYAAPKGERTNDGPNGADALYYIEVSGFDAGTTGRFTIETNTKLPPPLVDIDPS